MDKPVVYFIEVTLADKTRFICDIVEKLYQEQKRICIYCASLKEAAQLDQQLWTWRQDTFIPHCIVKSDQLPSDEPVCILTHPPADVIADVLILDSPLTNDQLQPFSMIIDFAEVFDKQRLHESRLRYKQFRDTGQYNLEFIKLGAFLRLD